MSEVALAKIGRRGQITIPLELRESLDIGPGDYVALRSLMGGVLLSKASVPPHIQAEDLLRQLVISLGREAEQHGICEDEDLDQVVEELQQQAYHERYGE